MRKRMKRILALGIGVMVIGTGACGTKADADPQKGVSEEQQVQNHTSQTQNSDSGKDMTEETPSEESAEKDQVDEQAFEEMMRMLSEYEEGTAGASLKRLNAAFGVLNFSEKYEEGQRDDLERKIRTYLEENANLDGETLQMKLEGIEPTASKVFSDGIESLKDQLSDAGNPNQYETYDQTKYEEVIDVFQKAFI